MQPSRVRTSFYRHRLPVRVMHWINVISFFLMLMSGLGIFNAHPHLYWGRDSDFDSPLLSMTARPGPDGQPHGVTQIGAHVFDTDGVLGASRVKGAAQKSERAFPSWATIPGRQYLARARNWHLFFGWGFVVNGILYVAFTVFSGHLRRDLLPPLRLRVERQLGYKQAKYLMRILVVERLDRIRGGAGGYWEDQGYEWYAGI